jgi:type IV pilus assembly protein PilX
MNFLPKLNFADFRSRLVPANSGIPAKQPSFSVSTHYFQQRGVVLFLTLLALLAMSLAAVALIRSVDTGTLIAGNLTFKQSTTSGADARLEDAMAWLSAQQLASDAKNVLMDPTHFSNNDNIGAGYYSFVDKTKSLTNMSAASHFLWTDADSSPEIIDKAGNKKRYIIQRMCLTANTIVSVNECLFGGAPRPEDGGQEVPLPSEVCIGPGCPVKGQTPQYRITVQSIGPKSTTSYVQAFAY